MLNFRNQNLRVCDYVTCTGTEGPFELMLVFLLLGKNTQVVVTLPNIEICFSKKVGQRAGINMVNQ